MIIGILDGKGIHAECETEGCDATIASVVYEGEDAFDVLFRANWQVTFDPLRGDAEEATICCPYCAGTEDQSDQVDTDD
jgi:hypothetical protein